MAATFASGVGAGRGRARRHRLAATVRCTSTLEGHNRRLFLDRVSETGSAGTVVVDLRPLRFFDAAGLRALVTAVRWVHDRGGRVWLRCAPGAVATRLAEAGVDRLVPIEMVCTRPAGGRSGGGTGYRATEA